MDRRSLITLAIVVGLLLLLAGGGDGGGFDFGVRRETVILLVVLVPAVILHEVSHGWVALGFGDDTAKRAGRLTLNPIAHVDPFGTVLLPLLLAIAGAPVFGYAKPVPVNPARLRDPRNQSVLVSLAGPATNIVLALAVALVLRAVVDFDGSTLSEAIVYFGIVNVLLATFNLLPLPPLDGSAVIERFLPDRWRPAWSRVRQYSILILLGLLLLFPAVLHRVFDVSLDLWYRLL